MIILYDKAEKAFNNNGLGCLSDATKCIVKENLNGEYELELEYPVDGIHYSDIAFERIILAKPNTYDETQPFRIYAISKPINGIVTVNAEHISYDMSNILVKGKSDQESGACDYYAWYTNEVFEHIRSNSLIQPFPFNLSSDISEEKKQVPLSKPRSARSYLGTDEGLLSVFGGEWVFDRFNATLLKERGANRGVVIEYGKNLTDLTQDEKCSEMYTGVYPFYYKAEDMLYTLAANNGVVDIVSNANYKKICPLDLTNDLSDEIDKRIEEMDNGEDSVDKNEMIKKMGQEILIDLSQKYIEENGLAKPKVSLNVSYVKNPEVMDSLQDIRIGDTVTVKFVKIGVYTTSRCISYEFDAITEQYNSVEFGDPTSTIVDTVVSNTKSIETETTEREESDQLILQEVDSTEKTLRSEINDGDKALDSKIEQTASSIRAEVSSLDSDLSAQLELKIGRDDDGTIISLINGSANKINFTATNMFTVDAPNLVIDGSGNVSMTGEVNATGGSIGKFTIDNEGLQYAEAEGVKLRDYTIFVRDVQTPEASTCMNIGDIIDEEKKVIMHGPVHIMNPGTTTSASNMRLIGDSKRVCIVKSESSRRFKHDIQPVVNYELDPHKLYDIDVVQFKYNADYVDPTDQRYNKDVIGFIAEDVYDKYPIAAEIGEMGIVDSWHERYIIPPMLLLIQEQHNEIEQLKMQNLMIKGEIDILKQKMEEK